MGLFSLRIAVDDSWLHRGSFGWRPHHAVAFGGCTGVDSAVVHWTDILYGCTPHESVPGDVGSGKKTSRGTLKSAQHGMRLWAGFACLQNSSRLHGQRRGLRRKVPGHNTRAQSRMREKG